MPYITDYWMQDKKCLCGHSYKRHLFQGWIPCKDCICGMWTLDEPDLPKWVRDTWEDNKLKTDAV